MKEKTTRRRSSSRVAWESCAKTRPSRHRRKNRASRNQTQTLAHERVTRRPPTFDCRSTHRWRRRVDRREAATRAVPKLGPFEIDHKSAA